MVDQGQVALPQDGSARVLPPLNLDNIQGDILEGIAKKSEKLIFFRINKDNVDSFRSQLVHLVPFITSTTDARKFKSDIKSAKEEAENAGKALDLLNNSAINIAFSHKGLIVLGINEDIQDDPFRSGQRDTAAKHLGDNLGNWDDAFNGDIHGVFLIVGNNSNIIDSAWSKVKRNFQVGSNSAGIEVVKELAGHTRPGAEDGHEHFGFNDGLTQPSIQDVTVVNQDGKESPIRQGIILLGREGDNGVCPPGQHEGPGPVKRPLWAIDGSFLAFRYLKQLVPEFDNFLATHPLDVPLEAGPEAGENLLGARLVGRWKSGAPVELAPAEDNPSLAVPGKNQEFRFAPDHQDRCPFAAHIRKTNPRADLDDRGGTEARRIVRRGIAFGPEVTPEEKQNKKSSEDENLERGLLFICYQSNIANGFQFIQQSWANNEKFPFPKGVSKPGFDPLIGVPLDGTQRQMVGFNPKDLASILDLTAEWVISRGGEYFFSPSISALKETFGRGNP